MVKVTLQLTPAVVIVALFFGGALFLGFLQALGDTPSVMEKGLSFTHFKNILTDPDFLKSLGLTFYIAAFSTLLAAVISIAAALALESLSQRYRWVHFIFQIPLTTPHLVVAIAVIYMLAPSGLIARLAHSLGVISSTSQFPLWVNDPYGIGIIAAYIWKEIPFITLMILSALRQSGRELTDVGKTLNAGPWQRFWYIILPVIAPSLSIACLIVFAYTFGAFEIPYLLGQTHPMLLPVWAYKNYSDVDLLARPEGIAAGLIIALIVILTMAAAYGVKRISDLRREVF